MKELLKVAKQTRRCPKRLVEKAAKTLPVIVGSVVDTILSFLSKAVGLVAGNALALIVFVVGLIGGMVDTKSKKLDTLIS